METEGVDFDEKVSIIMLGDAGVGKSCISVTFKSGKGAADNVNTTIGIDLWTKVVGIDDKRIKAVIYDTSGQERFRSIPKGYIRKGDGIVVVYDITDRESFDSMTYWISEVDWLREDKPPIIILGNKSDLKEQRQVKYKEGKEFADSYGAFFTETTIKDPATIDSAFQILIKTVYIKLMEGDLKKKRKEKKRDTKSKSSQISSSLILILRIILIIFLALHSGHYQNEMETLPACKSQGWEC